MKHTPGPWVVDETHKNEFEGITIWVKDVIIAHVNGRANAYLIKESPDMLEALKYAAETVKTARRYFPKSIKNSDRFTLENTCAAIGKAIYRAEGGE